MSQCKKNKLTSPKIGFISVILNTIFEWNTAQTLHSPSSLHLYLLKHFAICQPKPFSKCFSKSVLQSIQSTAERSISAKAYSQAGGLLTESAINKRQSTKKKKKKTPHNHVFSEKQ